MKQPQSKYLLSDIELKDETERANINKNTFNFLIDEYL